MVFKDIGRANPFNAGAIIFLLPIIRFNFVNEVDLDVMFTIIGAKHPSSQAQWEQKNRINILILSCTMRIYDNLR